MGGRDGLDVEVVHVNVHPRRRDRDEAVVEEDVPIDSMEKRDVLIEYCYSTRPKRREEGRRVKEGRRQKRGREDATACTSSWDITTLPKAGGVKRDPSQ